MKKVVGTGSLAVTTTFVYDASGTLVAEYATNTAGSQTGISYVTMDRLGSTRLLTLGVIPRGGQAAKARYDYLPFGEEINASYGNRSQVPGYNVEGSRQKYTGYERDIESGLDYAQARYYANTQGRFISADSVGGTATSPQTLNRYAYTGNNPVNNVDPSGHEFFSAQYSGSENFHEGSGGSWQSPDHNRDGISEEMKEKIWHFKDMFFDDACRALDAEAAQQQQDPSAERTNGNPDDERIDNQIAQLVTNGTGIVRGVSSSRNVSGRDTHNMLADGTVHTFHVYGNESATIRTDLYVPKSFSQIEWVGQSTVVATNPKTGEVLNYNHVLKTKGHKSPNEAGSRYIGQIGGEGAKRPGNIHAHITLYKNRESRDAAEGWRMEPTKIIIANTPGFTRFC